MKQRAGCRVEAAACLFLSVPANIFARKGRLRAPRTRLKAERKMHKGKNKNDIA